MNSSDKFFTLVLWTAFYEVLADGEHRLPASLFTILTNMQMSVYKVTSGCVSHSFQAN